MFVNVLISMCKKLNMCETMRKPSHFVCVDLAGSEGMSALTPAFQKQVSKKVLNTRRLEAGIINYGLSQLQKLLKEIRDKGIVSDFKETGLRRALHPYLNRETQISVLFTLNQSQSNKESTSGTLRVANFVRYFLFF